ncbi:MAG: dephospho-CoA kinase [Paracoccaceae bacterium]
MSYILGLTGSIGMGKSTTAGFFREIGVPVWDADAAVHTLYSKGNAGARAIANIIPGAIKNGAVDRGALRQAILADAGLLQKIEAAIHPLVSDHRAAFLAKNTNTSLIICDIPLLFETGADEWLDGVLVVTTTPEIQRQRVLARPDMSVEMFENILAKQIPDAEKRQRADFIIDTGKGLDHARQAAVSLAKQLQEAAHA